VAYIDQHKHRFGVEPICAALRAEGIAVAPSGYYAAKKRSPSRRALHDAALGETIEATFFDRNKGRGVYGARKMWHQLRRDRVTGVSGEPVARCTVERLMRELGLRGVRRGRPTITTRPDRHSDRAPDLVDRDFTAARPNQLWVVDLTYVPTWSGTVFTAFVSDVYSRRIVGWRTAGSMPTELPLDALEMALWTRERAGQTTDGRLEGLIHHSDAGSQGGFNWSSQHLDHGGVGWDGRGSRRRWRRPGRDDSGPRTGRCAHRCVRRAAPSRRERCSGSSGV